MTSPLFGRPATADWPCAMCPTREPEDRRRCRDQGWWDGEKGRPRRAGPEGEPCRGRTRGSWPGVSVFFWGDGGGTVQVVRAAVRKADWAPGVRRWTAESTFMALVSDRNDLPGQPGCASPFRRLRPRARNTTREPLQASGGPTVGGMPRRTRGGTGRPGHTRASLGTTKQQP